MTVLGDWSDLKAWYGGTYQVWFVPPAVDLPHVTWHARRWGAQLLDIIGADSATQLATLIDKDTAAAEDAEAERGLR